MKIIGQFILFLLACNLTWGQEQDVVLPSPETAALFRYQDYPMDHSTGLPQITIPLFTVQNRSLSVPISISYHASGCKVTDVDGPIAAGWSLNIGSSISRTIHGDPDFGEFPFPDPFETTLSGTTLEVLTALEQVTHYAHNIDLVNPIVDWRDSQYDIFSYNVGNHSGKFLFKDDGGVKTPVWLPQKPLLVTPGTDVNGLNGMTITDDNGDTYYFLGGEKTEGQNTSFLINKVVSANLKDSITYQYSGNTADQYRRFISKTQVYNDDWFTPASDPGNPGVEEEVPNERYYTIRRIEEIDFEQGKVEFVLRGGTDPGSDLIDYIQIRDRHGNPIRKIKFLRNSRHSVWGAAGAINLHTHKLVGLQIQDHNDVTEETYSFEYYPTVYSSSYPYDGNGIIDSRFTDFWGYYNASGQTNMIPLQQINTTSGPDTVGDPGVTRSPSEEALKSGVLKKIYYPTGGSTEFIYENNKYKEGEGGAIKSGPGLRVKAIINSDGQGSTVNRTFKYSNSKDLFTDYGEIDLEPKPDYMFTTTLHRHLPSLDPDHRERIFSSDFMPSLAEAAARPIRYPFVTEFRGTSPSDNQGKTLYEYDNYSWGAFPLAFHEGRNKLHIPSYQYWNTPMLKHQTDYKAIKEGATTTYHEVRKISNTYTTVTADIVKGLHVQRNYVFPLPDTQIQDLTTGEWFYIEQIFYDTYNEPVYAYASYDIPVGTKNLASTTETLTNDDGTTVMTQTSYEYNAQNFVSEVNTISSRINGATAQNSIHKKEILYTADSNDAPFGQMVNLNMLQYRVEEKDYFDDQPTNTSKIKYKDWGNTIYRPELVENSKADNNLEPRTNFHGYDSKGNPQEISKENGPHTYYIWGYHDTNPIAKIDNFTQAQATTIQALINAAKTASDDDNDRTRDDYSSQPYNYVGKEGSLRSALNEIRNHPSLSSSFMTSYTYDPLIGATSMTDPRGYTIYYEYDPFNRLKEVRDQDGNLVTDYEYSYKQPTN